MCKRNFSSRPTSIANKNWMLNILGYYSDESTSIRIADSLFQSCLDQSLKQEWFINNNIPNKFKSKHSLIISHIWILHKRLIKEDNDFNKLIQQALFDQLWENTSSRIRFEGINELSVNKNLLDVQNYSFKLFICYDRNFTIQNSESYYENINPLINNNITLNENLTLQNNRPLIKYFDNQYKNIQKLKLDSLHEGSIPWSNTPFYNTKNNFIDSNDEWREAISKTGKIYYWNIKTRESHWEKPITK